MGRLLLFIYVIFIFSIIYEQAFAQDVFYSTSTAIKRRNGNSEKSIVNRANGRFLGIDADIKRSKLYYVDSADSTSGIYSSDFDGNGEVRIVQYDNMQPIGLAVDWVFGHLYWTDVNYRAVMVSNLDGSSRVTLITEGLIQPRGITVDPKNMKLYIGDQGSHKVLRCDLDGQNCHDLRSDDDMIFWPNQITINYGDNKVYWTDGWTSKIGSCQLDATGCGVFNSYINESYSVNPLFGIAFSTTNSYHLTALHNQTVLQVTATGEVNEIAVNPDVELTTFIISIAVNINQPSVSSSHPCASSSHSCSDICLPSGNNLARCACPSGSGKLPEQGQCKDPQEFILYTNKDSGVVGMSNSNLNGDTTMIVRGYNPIAVTYDPVQKHVFFSDAEIGAIYRCNLDGGDLVEILNTSHGINQVEGLAIDFKQRHLYFTNIGYEEAFGIVRFWHTIEMVDLSDINMRRRILTSVESPRALQIDPNKRMLYYTDQGDNNAHVGRVNLDGYNQEILYKAVNPNGLVIRDNKLYVIDSRNRTGETPQLIVSDLSNDMQLESRTDLSSLTSVLSITSVGSELLVSDLEGFIGRYSTTGAIQGTVKQQAFTNIYMVEKTTPEAQDNGKCSNRVCSDICVTTDNTDYVTCLCPSYQHNILNNDRQTCSKPSKYILLADIDGIKMMAMAGSADRHVYNIIPSTSICGHFHGLTKDENYIYFSSYLGNTIYRANFDGSSMIELSTINKIGIVSLSVYGNFMYWTGLTNTTSKEGGIFSIDLNAPNNQSTAHIQNRYNPYGIAVYGRAIYWTEDDDGTILKMLIGSTYTILFPNTNYRGLAFSANYGNLFCAGPDIVMLSLSKSIPEVAGTFQSDDAQNLAVGETSVIFSSVWYPSVHNSSVYRLDTLQQFSRIKAMDLVRIGQMIIIEGQSQADQPTSKPGNCQNTKSSVSSLECRSDIDCFAKKKCCKESGWSTCQIPITGSFCSIGSYTMFNDSTSVINCQSCTCKGTAGACSPVLCPSLTNCPKENQIQNPGDCCLSCVATTSCSTKASFSNTPTSTIEVELPPDSNNVTIDLQKLRLTNVKATSCSGQSLPVSLSVNHLQWKKEVQIIKLVASDKHGRAQFDLRIEVKDVTPPTITNCPTEAVRVNGKGSDEGVMVLWQPVIAKDNAGPPTLSVVRGYENGAKFPFGVHRVEYEVTDGAGNVASPGCSFSVVVETVDITCPDPPSLYNGNLECKLSGQVTTCTIKNCFDGYLKQPGPSSFVCGEDGKWMPEFPDNFSTMTCIKPRSVSVVKRFEVTFNCPNANFTLRDLLNCLQMSGLCPSGDIDLCNHGLVGGSTERNIIKFTGQTTGTLQYNAVEQKYNNSRNNLISRITNVNTRIRNFFNNGDFESRCPAITCSFRNYQKSNVQILCPYGATKHIIENKEICANCAPGTHYVISGPRCDMCTSGQYQDESGQPNCKTCLSGYTSVRGAFYVGQCTPEDTSLPITRMSGTTIVLPIILAAVLLIIALVLLIVFIQRRRSKLLHSAPLTVTNNVYDNDEEYASLSENKVKFVRLEEN